MKRQSLTNHLRCTDSELARFRELVRAMTRHSSLYAMLRDELSARGNWKAAPRGNPREGLRRQQAGANSGLAMHNYAETDQISCSDA